MLQRLKLFLEWWRATLLEMLPQSLRFALTGYPVARLLTFSSDTEDLRWSRNAIVAPQDVFTSGLLPSTSQNRKSAIVDVVWPASLALKRNVAVPRLNHLAAQRALDLDLQRATPFSLQEICWSNSVITHSKTGSEYVQTVVKRSDVEGLKTLLASHNIHIRRILAQGTPSGVLADWSGELANKFRFWRRINMLMMVIAFALIAIMFWTPLRVLQQDIEALNVQGETLREAAFVMRSTLEQESQQSDGTDALSDVLTSGPLMTSSLANLSDELPDRVWLSEFQYRPDVLTATGSINGVAAELVLSLAKSSNFNNPRLKTSTPVPGAQSSERFEILLETKGRFQ